MNAPVIEVGVLSSHSIRFKLNGKFSSASVDDFLLLEPQNEEECNFELYHVVIGVDFHWEREETQRFKGKLKLFAENGLITAVNILPLEDYLLSVISSEMSAASSLEFLKAHAVISRSWLLAQMEKGKKLREAAAMKV